MVEDKKKRSDRSLGSDPFENIHWEENDSALEPVQPAEPQISEEMAPASDLPAWLDIPIEGDIQDSASSTDDKALENQRNASLDELIAGIDQNIGQILGAGVMAGTESSPTLSTQSKSERSDIQEQFVLFSLAGTEYATPIANVTEIGRPLEITAVPNVPGWVLGVANLRGDIISVVDLRAFLGMETGNATPSTRMMVARAGSENMSASLIVDRVSGIRYLPVDRIHPPAAPIEGTVAAYLQGMCEYEERLLVVLNFDRLLLSAEMQQFRPV